MKQNNYGAFQRFKVSKCFDICWCNIIKQIISCFLEDIDPIFKISKNCLDGSPGSFGTYLLETFIFDFKKTRHPTIINENESGLFLICLRYPSVSKKIRLVLRLRTTSKNREIMKVMGFWVFQIMKSESC